MKKLILAIFIFFAFTANAQTSDTAKSTIPVDSTVFTKVDVEASFPGGEQEWNKYIQKVVERNIDRIMKNKASLGTCEIQFIVDKEGYVTNVEALTLKNSVLAKVFVDAVKNGPRWNPAQQNGRFVKAWRRQKVTILPPEK